MVEHTGYIFISYATQDMQTVAKLRNRLGRAGVEVWIDREGLLPGTPSWEQAIRKAIKGAIAILLVASPSSAVSNYVRGELHVADMYRKPVYPIWIAGEDWRECVPLGLIETQYVDARVSRYRSAVTKLITTLNKLLAETATRALSEHDLESSTEFVPRNPYKGLSAFTNKDTRDFFGRDRLMHELLGYVEKSQTTNQRILAVVGPSGSGKSSLVLAGLLPQLRAGSIAGSEEWVYLRPIYPGTHPLEALAIALSEALNVSVTQVLEDVTFGSRGLHTFAQRIRRHRKSTVVLVVDQFEELFSQAVDENERSQFIDVISTATCEPNGALFLILTLRADFYDRPMNYVAFGTLMEQCSKSVLPMSLDDLRAVIEKPAQAPDVRLEFENGLVGDLLFDVRGQMSALPLLEFALDQLFRQRDGRRITASAYQIIGGVRGALAEHAENTFLSLSSDMHKKLALDLFLRLVEPSDSEQDVTRRRALVTELITSDAEETNILKEVANAFVNARLLAVTETSNGSSIELGHEAILRAWERLANVIRERYLDLRTHRSITHDERLWTRSDGSPDYLYRGEKLKKALDCASRVTLSIDEQNFLTKSEQMFGAKQNALLIPDVRVRQRDFLLEINRATTSQLDLAEVLRRVLNASVAMLSGKAGFITLRDANSHYRIRAAVGVDSSQFADLNKALEKVLAVEQPDYALLDAQLREIARILDRTLRQSFAVPLVYSSERLGLLVVFREAVINATEDDVKVLQSFGDQAAISLRNAQLYERIVEERRRLAAIVNDSADGLMVLDKQCRILSINRAMENITGWKATDSVGQEYSYVLRWNDRKGANLEKALSDGWPYKREVDEREPLYVEGEIVRLDGSTVSIGIKHGAVLSDDGNLVNIVVSVRQFDDAIT